MRSGGNAARKKRAATKAAPARSVATARDAFAATPHRLRIIGGQYKRTPIPVAAVPGLRPTPDRVRETLFNWIAHFRPDLTATRGLDLFAGAGGLGFELASRGALHVTLVEHSPQLLVNLRALRERLGAAHVEIVAGDAFEIARRWAPASFDLIFLDPPFDSGVMDAALTVAARLITPAGLVYAESGAPISEAQAGESGFEIVRNDRAGRVYFHLLR